jgi:hypothetical protein
MKPCPVCGSNEIYQYQDYFSDPSSPGGATLLPGLASLLGVAKIRPCVCQRCGYIQIFASEEAREKLKASKHWKAVDD